MVLAEFGAQSVEALVKQVMIGTKNVAVSAVIAVVKGQKVRLNVEDVEVLAQKTKHICI